MTILWVAKASVFRCCCEGIRRGKSFVANQIAIKAINSYDLKKNTLYEKELSFFGNDAADKIRLALVEDLQLEIK